MMRLAGHVDTAQDLDVVPINSPRTVGLTTDLLAFLPVF
jgi:hypothetical protein